MHFSWALIISSVFILLLNIPFGYWRAMTKRFSLRWYLAIHLPIPLIVLLRLELDIGWHWSTYVFFILAFSLGQFIGGKWFHYAKRSSSPGME
jgi:hypothetical protein